MIKLVRKLTSPDQKKRNARETLLLRWAKMVKLIMYRYDYSFFWAEKQGESALAK